VYNVVTAGETAQFTNKPMKIKLQADQAKKSAEIALRAKLQAHYDQQAETVGAMRLPTPSPLIVDELPILSQSISHNKQPN
jgi:pyridoxine/pyridoxamine 5'-phosphate oxidase